MGEVTHQPPVAVAHRHRDRHDVDPGPEALDDVPLRALREARDTRRQQHGGQGHDGPSSAAGVAHGPTIIIAVG